MNDDDLQNRLDNALGELEEYKNRLAYCRAAFEELVEWVAKEDRRAARALREHGIKVERE
jgi:hypothetical protein